MAKALHPADLEFGNKAADLLLPTENCIDLHHIGVPAFIRYPAVRALLIQFVALLATLILGVFLTLYSGTRVSWWVLVLIQGSVAAGITWRLEMASWWIAIQLLFVPALVVLNTLQWPPYIYLTIFVLLLGLYWSTFRTQVPLYPSGPATWHAVKQVLPAGSFRFVDIGSGMGGLLIDLARKRPDAEFTGVELAPLTWLLSLVRGKLSRSSARFLCRSYEDLNFADFDVVFAYLSPAAMPALWSKARTEMRPGSVLISFEFPVKGIQPGFMVTPRADSDKKLYCWTM